MYLSIDLCVYVFRYLFAVCIHVCIKGRAVYVDISINK